MPSATPLYIEGLRQKFLGCYYQTLSSDHPEAHFREGCLWSGGAAEIIQ